MKSRFLSSPTPPELSKSQQKEDDSDILVYLKNRFKLMTYGTEWWVPAGNVLRRMKNYHFRQVRKCKGTGRRAGHCDGHCPVLEAVQQPSPTSGCPSGSAHRGKCSQIIISWECLMEEEPCTEHVELLFFLSVWALPIPTARKTQNRTPFI